MRIAIITNYDKTNYGSILQAFALQKKLKELGAESYVLQKISVRKRSIGNRLKKFFFKSGNNYSIKDKIAIKKAKKEFKLKRSRLLEFCDTNITSRQCISLNAAKILVGDTDVAIAGSDQIWSPVAGTLSDFTLLNFLPTHIRKYSYAASIGTEILSPENIALMKNSLKSFHEVSLRERSSAELLRSLNICDDPHTEIDPTLLYDGKFWNELANVPCSYTNYIFVYMLRPEPLTLSLAKSLSQKTGLKIILCSNRIISDKDIINDTDAGIPEFLSYIKNASFVITNSFHGTAFSVQFHKQFLSVAVEGSGLRVKDFLNDIGLQSRIASSPENLSKIFDAIKWEDIEDEIMSFRIKAHEYLERIVACSSEKTSLKSDSITLFREKSECSGCGACMNICPQNAITMQKDACGFLYPQISRDMCINCKQCKAVCNYQKELFQTVPKQALVSVCSDDNIRLKSASGGVFTAIAKAFIEKGGIVFGCEMQDRTSGLTPAHICVESLDDLWKLQSSKYAQSEIGLIYKSVQQKLVSGVNVMFSGTPCQVAGLRGFLKNKHYENLFLVDLICHGVPSVDLLNEYLKLLENKKKIKVKGINFRDKKYGWSVNGTIRYLKSLSTT